MYTQSNIIEQGKTAKCSVCQSTKVQFSAGKLTCKDCGELIASTNRSNKYGARRTEYKGKIYDSGFEANVAYSLEVRKRARDILDYDTQYKVTCIAYTESGDIGFKKDHKVDFRIHHTDGTFELLEAKGVETDDYKWRRLCLETLWLPLHRDHTYTVVKDKPYAKKRKMY